MIEKIWYIALQSFGPSNREEWQKYIEWSKLFQLKELVSLDTHICKRVINEFTSEDWEHNVHEDMCLDFFLNLSYLTERVKDIPNVNLIATIRDPSDDPSTKFIADNFEFCGFDLLEDATGISALTDCGGFPESFNNSELSDLGLLTDYKRAREVQRLLKQNNPDEHHADCALWALWRLKNRAI